MGAEVRAYEMGYRVTSEGTVIGIRGKPLIGWTDKWGYLCFRAGHSLNVSVHRLVAYQKFGARLLEPGIETRHVDDDPGNARWENIEIGTHSQNMMDMSPEMRLANSQAASDVLRKLTDDEVIKLRRLRSEGAKYSDLMEMFGICKSSVSYVVNKKTYSRVADKQSRLPVKE